MQVSTLGPEKVFEEEVGLCLSSDAFGARMSIEALAL
jgi:hypothetical protein